MDVTVLSMGKKLRNYENLCKSKDEKTGTEAPRYQKNLTEK